MLKEFEGKTEQEAIDHAIDELGLNREEFDVEIVETTKKGLLFKKGTVKIRVHVTEEDIEEEGEEDLTFPDNKREPDEKEKNIMVFLETCIKKMGYSGTVTLSSIRDQKIIFDIDSDNSGILIGRKGKNLDALQLLANVYAGKLDYSKRIILDSENYRTRREESLVRMAQKAAQQVRKSKRSKLLEPMNPFERRLVHTSLNEMEDVDTKSEGDGLYKQIRVIYRGIHN